MTSSKKRGPILIVVLTGFLLTVLFLVLTSSSPDQGQQRDQQGEQRDPTNGIYLKPDMGLNIDFVDIATLNVDIENAKSGEDGIVRERVIFARYRFYDAQTDEEIDIRPEAVKVFVTEPGSEESEITTGNIFYQMHLYPFPTPGEYAFRVVMPDGQEQRTTLNFPEPQRAELIFGDTQPNPDASLAVLRSVSLKGVDMTNVELIYQILLNNGVILILPDKEGVFLTEADALEADHHVFIAKQGNSWYSAAHINPEE